MKTSTLKKTLRKNKTNKLIALAVAVVVAIALIISIAGMAAVGEKRILLMGSSTTGCAGQITPSQCYVNLIKEARPNDQVTQLGRGGTYVGYGTPSQNWTQTPIPGGHDLVVIQLGINDWYVPVKSATYKQQLTSLLSRVKTANPDAKIFWVRTWTPTPAGYADARQGIWVEHGWVTADAVEAAGGTFIDMSGNPQFYRSSVAGDNGWHYNAAGHKKIADSVLNAFRFEEMAP